MAARYPYLLTQSISWEVPYNGPTHDSMSAFCLELLQDLIMEPFWPYDELTFHGAVSVPQIQGNSR